MTNTFMLNGDRAPEEIIASVKNGIYAPFFGGGQVDITSGKFVFSCTEAWRIENGKITHPLKGAMLIGHGPDALTKISMIGNDMKLDPWHRHLRQRGSRRAGRRRAADDPAQRHHRRRITSRLTRLETPHESHEKSVPEKIILENCAERRILFIFTPTKAIRPANGYIITEAMIISGDDLQ